MTHYWIKNYSDGMFIIIIRIAFEKNKRLPKAKLQWNKKIRKLNG